MEVLDFIMANWELFLAAFYIAEKVVKLSKSRKDDILVDIIWGGIKILVGGRSKQ